MIKLKNIIKHLILEKLSFKDLLRHSDPERIKRAGHVGAKSIGVQSNDSQERWAFSYKSQGSNSTTGMRHKGYIQFFKEDVSSKDNAEDLDCIVDCSCPDFSYRYAYNDNKAGATPIGSTAINSNNGQKWKDISRGGVGDHGIGMCKHLIALGEYLKTNLETPEENPSTPVAGTTQDIPEPAPKVTPSVKNPTMTSPTPEDDHTIPEPVLPVKPKIAPKKIQPKQKPDNGYTDSRSDSSGLTENVGANLALKFESFVKNHPTFEVKYPE